VLVHVLTREEGRVDFMHYGLFESEADSIGKAQERSTALLLSRLPPPPCRLLEVGIGLGTTLSRLTGMGYDAEGITLDPQQVAAAKARFGEALRVHQTPLEYFVTDSRYDAIVFQESSQYIESEALFRKLRELAAPDASVVVLDEFALQPLEEPGSLHRLDVFLAAAARRQFRLDEDLDVSRQALPTVGWFLERIPRHRAEIERELSVDAAQLDALLASGAAYQEHYRSGAYGYRLLRFAA
jgi:hypothetical protein